MTTAELTALLKSAFPDGEVEVKDLTGTSEHYQASIVSDAFAGKSRLEQHRMVYAVVGKAMGGAVHALALQTSAREKR